MDASRDPATGRRQAAIDTEGPDQAGTRPPITLNRSDEEVQELGYRPGTGPSVLVLVVAMVLLTALSTWFGYLDVGRPHPTLKLTLSMVITVWGLGSVLLVRLIQERGGRTMADLLRTTVGLLLMAAALIHFAVIRQHVLEYWLYGWFFAAIGLGQLIGGLLVVVRPRRWLFWSIVLGDVLVALTWVITRIYGTVIGPDASTPEKVGFGDVVSTLFEVVIVIIAIVLVRSRLPEKTSRSEGGDVMSGFLALFIAPLCALSLYSAVAGPPFVSHVG
jgi:hypothetical protein